MAANLNNHSNERQLTAVATTSFSNGSTEQKFVGDILYTNTSVSNVEITLWILQNATTATEGSGGNWFLRKTIAAGKTLEVSAGMVLNTDMKWAAKADTASVVNENISGITET